MSSVRRVLKSGARAEGVENRGGAGRTWRSGRAPAVGHSMYRHPIRIIKRPRSSSGYAEARQGLDVVQETAAWREGGRD